MPNDEGGGDDATEEKPRLVLTSWVRGTPFFYKCSGCGHPFLLPEDRSPVEGASELLAAFREHVDEKHREGAERTEERGDDATGKG
jgi:hypothetical protein